MEYMTHKAEVKWGPEVISDEKRNEIEKSVKALIDALDRTHVESIVLTKIEDNDTEKKETTGGSSEDAE